MSLFQRYSDNAQGVVVFIDHKQNHHSTYCQPRDIEIITPVSIDQRERDRLREDIAVEIRRNQGYGGMDVRKHLKWS